MLRRIAAKSRLFLAESFTPREVEGERGLSAVVGDTWRLTYSNSLANTYDYKLEELPTPKVKNLKRAGFPNMMNRMMRMLSGYTPQFTELLFHVPSMVKNAGLSASDSFETVMKKIREEHLVQLDYFEERHHTAYEYVKEKYPTWWRYELSVPEWIEQSVPARYVVPEGKLPFKGSNGRVSWTVKFDDFSITVSYNDDPHNPSYTAYKASSPTAANKLHKILEKNPKALDSVDAPGDWLKAQGVKYKSYSSSWH